MAEITQQPSAPPVIRIKRKRDDTPLDSLYLERGKKRAATEHTYVFKRLGKDATAVRQEYDDDGIPKVRSTAVGEEKRDPLALGKVHGVARYEGEVQQGPRRFHLARLGAVRARSRSGRGGDVATFVERTGMRREKVGEQWGMNGGGPVADAQGREETEIFKRPSTKARVQQRDIAKTGDLDVTSDPDRELMQKLDEWSQETSQKEKEEKAVAAASLGGVPAGDAMDVDNEADYVYDTYYRHVIPSYAVPDKGISFGHLVIGEKEEELWETYMDDEEDDEKEFETDDEDSNAEDYYGADYPEEEVASDDEYDRDAYQYRKGASDNEEFDLAGDDDDNKIIHSDDEVDEELSSARAWRRDFAKTGAPTLGHGDAMTE